MKKIKKQNLIKKIMYIITIFLMLFNFIMPNDVYAGNLIEAYIKAQSKRSYTLTEALTAFLCFIPDVVINFLQNMFVSPQGIEITPYDYEILYSAGTIFAGQIPAFDINFIKPGKSKIVEKYVDVSAKDMAKKVYEQQYAGGISFEMLLTKKEVIIKEIKEADEYEYAENRKVDTSTLDKIFNMIKRESGQFLIFNITFVEECNIECAWYNSDKTAVYIMMEVIEYDDHLYDELLKKKFIEVYKLDVAYINESGKIISEIKEYKSSAQILQPLIAGWYNELRRVALVGLLSVLLYIGIRIALTSTSAKDKAKYKNMLKDWLMALCLLFALHYIMSLTITIVENINGILSQSVIGPNGEDVLMSTVRNSIAVLEENLAENLAIVYVIIYCVLAVYTVIFTIQYVRRTIYIGFLTVISPLITLTYPLDKIKDGKSQAFDMWIKDYMFFVLVQVVHLLLYYILVASTIDLTKEWNWMYAIVAIGFFTKAEKIMKKMFGFEKSKTLGAMAAGATGALVMNAMNKITNKPPKQGQAGSSGGTSKNVRTATNPDVLSSIRNGGAAGSGSSSGSGAGTPTPPTPPTPLTNPAGNGGTNTGSSTRPKKIKGGGAKALLGKYHRKIGGAVLGTALSGAGAMIGFAAGVSQGDMGAALGGALVGGKAGYALGGRAYNGVFDTPGNIRKAINNIGDTWNEGAFGEDYAGNTKFDREFRRSSTYKSLKQKYGENFSDESVRAMLKAGITEKDAMDKILKNVTQGNGYSVDDAIGYYALTKMCRDAGVYYDDEKLKIWLKDQGFGEVSDVTQIKKHMSNF